MEHGAAGRRTVIALRHAREERRHVRALVPRMMVRKHAPVKLHKIATATLTPVQVRLSKTCVFAMGRRVLFGDYKIFNII